ncbi:hypothetical protein TWF506_010729 [Arthrobotrys conoides]|uniref:Uncharacterized protein n=1 Tax=Arthrobotrys conoides TaxID=74498 RepID=A0AAN8RSI4_9PEZI
MLSNTKSIAERLETGPPFSENPGKTISSNSTQQTPKPGKNIRVRAPPEAHILPKGIDPKTSQCIMLGLNLVRWEAEDMYTIPEFEGVSEIKCRNAIEYAQISTKENSDVIQQYIRDFFESIGRSEIITDLKHYHAYEVASSEPLTTPVLCLYSPKDRNLIFKMMEEVTGPVSGLGATIYACWHAASKAEPGNSEPFESPRYIMIQGILDSYSLEAIQRLAKLWSQSKMDMLPKGGGLSVYRADVNFDMVEGKDLVSILDYGDLGMTIQSAAWAILYQPRHIGAIIDFLGEYYYGSRLQISNIRFALYKSDGSLASKSDVDNDSGLKATERADIFLELEKRPSAHSGGNPEEDNTKTPSEVENPSDEEMEDPNPWEGVGPSGFGSPSDFFDEDIIMSEAPSRLRSPSPALRISTWVSRPEFAPIDHLLGPKWLSGGPSLYPPSYVRLTLQYDAGVSFEAYASRLEQHLILLPKLESPDPPDIVIPPHQLANIIRSAWLHSVGEAIFGGITLGNLLPKTADNLQGLKDKMEPGPILRQGATEDSFFITEQEISMSSQHQDGGGRFNQVEEQLKGTWEGQSIYNLIQTDNGILGINYISGLQYGSLKEIPSDVGIDAEARFLTFKFSREPPKGLSEDNFKFRPIDVDNLKFLLVDGSSPDKSTVIPPMNRDLDPAPSPNNAFQQAQEAAGRDPALAEHITLSFERGTHFQIEDLYSASRNLLDSESSLPTIISSAEERIRELALKYRRKHIGNIKAGVPNTVFNHEIATAVIKFAVSPNLFKDFDLLMDSYIRHQYEYWETLRTPAKMDAAAYDLSVFGSAQDELEANDKSLPHFAWSTELGHMVIAQQPSQDWLAARSFSLCDMFAIGTWGIGENNQPTPPQNIMTSDQIRFFTFLDVQPVSRAILSYIFNIPGFYDKSLPTLLRNPFSGPRRHDTYKNGVMERLFWLIVSGLPEIRGVSQYAADISSFKIPRMASERDEYKPQVINAIVVLWANRNHAEAGTPDIYPIIFVQLSNLSLQNSIVKDTSQLLYYNSELIIQEHLRTGRRLELQEIYRPFLPKLTERSNVPSKDDWAPTISPLFVKPPDGVIDFLSSAVTSIGRMRTYQEDHIKTEWKDISAAYIFFGVRVTNTRESLSLNSLVDRKGTLIVVLDGIETIGEPEEGLNKFASAIYATWHAALSRRTRLSTLGPPVKFNVPVFVALISLSKRTEQLLVDIFTKKGKYEYLSPRNRTPSQYGRNFAGRTAQIEGQDIIFNRPALSIKYGALTVEDENFFNLILGTPEVGSVLQAFQNYQSEMGTWKYFVSKIYISTQKPGFGAGPGPYSIFIRFSKRK